MNLINEKVRHKTFGSGTIVEFDEEYLRVEFKDVTKKFAFPNAFMGFMTIDNPTLAIEIGEKIKVVEAQKDLEDEERFKKIEAEKQRAQRERIEPKLKKKKDYPRENVAFKCTFCDGGNSKECIGYRGACSDELIAHNIKVEKKPICMDKEGPCRMYLEGQLTREELDNMCAEDGYVCPESQTLRLWRAFAGTVQTGARKGQPIVLNKVQPNSLCMLTTREPKKEEKDRFIFAVFLADENFDGDNIEEGLVGTESKYRIMLNPEEARQILFWNYHENEKLPNVAAWKTGLLRYLDQECAAQVLKDIAAIKVGTKDEELAKEFMQHFCKVNNLKIDNITKPYGALTKTVMEG
ncbi:MAG: hypothetical protein RR313_07555 [Anaerovoracaceae bacterium]